MTAVEREAVHLAIVALAGLAYAERPYGNCAREGLKALCVVGLDREVRAALDAAETSMPGHLRTFSANQRADWPLELRRSRAEGT